MSLFGRFRGKGKDEQAGAADEPAAGAPEASSATPAAPPEKKGLFAGLRNALRKTASVLRTDIRDLFGAEGRLLDDDLLRDVFGALIKTDMGVAPATEIRESLKKEFRGRKVKLEDVMQVVKAKFAEMMQQEHGELIRAESGPTVVMVVGVNGSGKTTSIAKLANHFHHELGLRVVLGAADTFRAAAVEQLTIWAERIGVDIVKGQQGGDPASVAYKAVERAVETNADICIVDTAGRLQSQVNLMNQLTKIRRVMTKLIPDAPHEVLLVIDATAGQNGISQAKGFSEAVQCTGIVLSKLDGSAKGGVVIPIRQQFDLPVKFVGEGEKEADLSAFDPARFVDALFDE
ncbi:MAG: signal recognition particle-docking protein FtsY [Planctomycetales bacterium]|nr:signal recognition particle-docking protein FtsY [Planctomycetales bacterium]